MKAVRLHERGGPEKIVVEDAPNPVAGPGEVRIRVRAAAITPRELTWDETYSHPDGSPRLPTIPGHDVAGTIDAMGPNVKDFAIGDSVYALVDFPRDGSAADYVVVPATDIARAPRKLSPEQAAAVPLSALTAWQSLFDHGKLEPGQRVLIHGGSGGVGAFAVQLAHWRNAHVITTASTQNVQMVRDLGADQVVDYTSTPFEKAVNDVDLVFDTIGGDTLAKSLDVIRPGGRLVSIAAQPDSKKADAKRITALFFIVRPSRPQLEQIAGLIDAGDLRVNIQDTYPMQDARKAFERSMAGHLTGKVVLQIQ